MLPRRRRLRLRLLLLLLVLLLPPPTTAALSLRQYRTLLSLSHSLMTRVANARAAKGNAPGADRATKIAAHIHSLSHGGLSIWSMGWDFAWNYAWSGGLQLPTVETARAAAELVSALAEAYRLDSASDRANWALRNHVRLRSISGSLFRSLLKSFSQPGPLRDAVLALQREVYEGELLKDCLEVGARDLEGLIGIAREIFSSEPDHAEL